MDTGNAHAYFLVKPIRGDQFKMDNPTELSIPVQTDSPPQMIMQEGRYIEGFPMWFRNMLLQDYFNDEDFAKLGHDTHEGTCIKI